MSASPFNKSVINKALLKLIQHHHKHSGTPVIFAARFRRRGASDIHLLEICDGVSNPGDASWDTFDFLPPPELKFPKGTMLKVTYIGPDEFFQALDQPRSLGFKLLEEIKRNGLDVLFIDRGHALCSQIEEVIHGKTVG